MANFIVAFITIFYSCKWGKISQQFLEFISMLRFFEGLGVCRSGAYKNIQSKQFLWAIIV